MPLDYRSIFNVAVFLRKDYPMQRNPQPILPDCLDPKLDHFKYTQDLMDSYNPDSHRCERCGKEVWASENAGSYTRGFVYPKDGSPAFAKIRVPLILCEGCGCSLDGSGRVDGDYKHAILPMTIVPFTAYSLLFILTVLDAYANRTCTVVEVCAHWQIAVSTLYVWKKRYKEHYDAWARSIENPLNSQDNVPSSGSGMAFRKAMIQSLATIRSDLPKFIKAFFHRFGFSFLQPNRKTHFRELSGKRRARI